MNDARLQKRFIFYDAGNNYTLLFLERATQIIWTHRTPNTQHYDGLFQPEWLNSEVIIGRKLISLNDIMSQFFRRGQR